MMNTNDEHFFGIVHSWDNEFYLKGTVIDLKHINAKCTVPYVYSSLGYGFLWNVPSIGRVDYAKNKTRWHSDCCQAIEYVVIDGMPMEAAETLADLTGHAPEMPYWATAFWQCRLRYETQEELLSVVRKYRELGIPLSAIIVDYFHWTEQGDYKFDPKYWPDVKAMADELHETDTKLLVSMWSTINEKSGNYRHMVENNMLIRTARGSDRLFDFYGWQAQIDVSNPATHEYVWSKLKENYADKSEATYGNRNFRQYLQGIDYLRSEEKAEYNARVKTYVTKNRLTKSSTETVGIHCQQQKNIGILQIFLVSLEPFLAFLKCS